MADNGVTAMRLYERMRWIVLVFGLGVAVNAGAAVVPRTDIPALSRHLQTLEARVGILARQVRSGSLKGTARRLRRLNGQLHALQLQVDLAALRIDAAADARTQLVANLDGRLQAARQRRRFRPPEPARGGSLPTFDERHAYVQAFTPLREGHAERARLALGRYLRRFPNRRSSADALYWIAEINYALNRLPLARSDFNKLLRDYPHSGKAVSALLRLGQIAEQEGRCRRAGELYGAVLGDHSGSAQARLAGEWLGHLRTPRSVCSGPAAKRRRHGRERS